MLKEAGIQMGKKGYSSFDLVTDRTKLENVADAVSTKRLKQKEDVEIFIALSSCLAFFGKNNSKIGFPLVDSFNPKKDIVKTLEELKAVSKEYHLTDFAIFYNDGKKQNICEFQLKQYKQKITTEKLLEEMKKKIGKYGGKLGTTNIIFNLQGNGPPFSKYDIDFVEIHNGVKSIINSETTGHVYIKYNEQNTHATMIEVYPKIIKSKAIININILFFVGDKRMEVKLL